MDKTLLCTVINPYCCPNCGQNMLFFATDKGMLIDYKMMFNKQYTKYDIINHLSNKKIRYMKCIACGKTYILDWRNGYPYPLTDVEVIKQFGY